MVSYTMIMFSTRSSA